MNKHQFAVGSLLALFTSHCGAPGNDTGESNLEVAVVVSAEEVGVFATTAKGCREATGFVDSNACETFGWALVGVQNTSATERCTPEPTCVEEVRLEVGGETVAAAEGPSVGFFTHLEDSSATVVIEGCGEPIEVALPAPLSDEVELDVQAVESGLHVTAEGASVDSLLARAEGLPGYPRGFLASCRGDATGVSVPTSDDFDTYAVEIAALASPVDMGERVTVFPARVGRGMVSRSADLGPLWDAAVVAAEQSSHFTSCQSYCTSWGEQCAEGGDIEGCSVQCVVNGELAPSCSEAWHDLLDCMSDAPCSRSLVVEYAEDPLRRSTELLGTTCESERMSYEACVGAE
jgi:hypothetical protein